MFLEFSVKTRQVESQKYLRTLTGESDEIIWGCNDEKHHAITGQCLSLDNTFRVAKKATVIDNQKARSQVMKGGILSVINENNEILSWVRITYDDDVKD